MDVKNIQKIKTELEARRNQIKTELARFTTEDRHATLKHRPEFSDFGSESDDNAKEIDDYTTNLSLTKVLDNDLEDIEKALKRIADGTYGICKYCGNAIDEKRLLARPVSSACISCKNRLQNES